MARLLVILALMLGSATATLAGERSSLWPDIPKASGQAHPEGNEYWRRNHMTLMKHDRNLTMRNGDRQIGASLKSCFNCHSVKDDTGHVVTIQSEKHFCRACHDYAAVKVDCFMCHRSTPDGVDEAPLHAQASSLPKTARQDADTIVAYLAQVAREDAAVRATGAGQ